MFTKILLILIGIVLFCYAFNKFEEKLRYNLMLLGGFLLFIIGLCLPDNVNLKHNLQVFFDQYSPYEKVEIIDVDQIGSHTFDVKFESQGGLYDITVKMCPNNIEVLNYVENN